MAPTLLVIGANGQVGSATIRAALSRGLSTYAYLRTPSKLPTDLSSNTNLTIIQGDALNAESISETLTSKFDAVIVAAPYGDMRGRRSGYEQIAKNVIKAVQDAQKIKGKEIKLWLMAGSAVLEHPELPGTYLADLMPMTFYPEYRVIIDYLKENAEDVNWTMNCPALIKSGKPVGPAVDSITTPPLFQPPFAFTRYVPFKLGYASNTMYNWTTGPVTFQTLGEYMVDHLDLDERLRGKRIGVLEDKNARRV